MGNKVTDDLPISIDSTLQDIAQMHGGIDYGDIIKFGKAASPSDLRKVRKLTNQIKDEDGLEDETINELVVFIHKTIKKN